MKTLLPFASVSWLTLSLAACGGGGDVAPVAVMATDTDEVAAPLDDVEPSADMGYPRWPSASDLEGRLEAIALATPLAARAPVEDPVERGFALSWRDCGVAGSRAVQCAEMQVPLDYDDPESELILIALNRILAPATEPHRGSILYNPGGPGGSGKEIARAIASFGGFDAAAPGFDIIGFDPRGVGESSGLECEFIEAYLSGETGDASPAEAMTEAASEYGLEGMIEDLSWLSGECRTYWGELFNHLGSNQVVKDIDRIREALGEEQLNFLGMSYGTRLGALYAQEFPERVRAIVLDAPVGPEASIVEQVQGQFDELLVVHEAFFDECEAGRFTCPPDARELFDAYVSSADALGLLYPMLDVWELGVSTSGAAYFLIYLLQQQAEQPTSDWMYDALAVLDSDPTGFIQNMNVNCADNALPLLTLDEANARLDDAYERSPLFAGQLMPAVSCNGWTVAPDPVAPLTAPDAPPLLVIGGTHDRRTPGHLAQELADSLESGVLLQSEHWGHTIVGSGSACVDDAVRNYFVDLVVPAAGTVCPMPEL
jgi:pimeloyl-ACP methyl ester carboxylesterase